MSISGVILRYVAAEKSSRTLSTFRAFRLACLVLLASSHFLRSRKCFWSFL